MRAAGAVIDLDSGATTNHGDIGDVFDLASISKVLTAWAILVAVEEGSITLDSAVGQPGCTLRHLLSHSGGYAFDGETPIALPGRRRIYSNVGIERGAAAVALATGIDFATYLSEAVLGPLEMNRTELVGSPAHGVRSSVADLVRFVDEISRPTLLSGATVSVATSIQFPELSGLVPGIGVFRPCPWGLGVEIHGAKQPHWMGSRNSAETFGHFGGAGTMMWIDPINRVGLIALTDRSFDEWSADALRLWPELSNAVIAAAH